MFTKSTTFMVILFFFFFFERKNLGLEQFYWRIKGFE